MIINRNDVKLLSSIDDIGQIFFWKNRVFRAINENKVQEVHELLNSGLIDELVRSGLFPETKIAEDISLDGFSLVLEHHRIPYVLLPMELSFHMLKDLCVTYIAVVKTCRRFGYSLKDGHLYNLTFLDNRPVFFDFGSITPKKNQWGWHEFFISAIMPLLIWSKGDFYLASLILRDEASYQRFLPSVPLDQQKSLRQTAALFKEKSLFWFIRRTCNFLCRKLWQKNIFEPYQPSIEKMAKRIERTKKVRLKTIWGDYHNEYFSEIDVKSTHRFNRLIEVLNSLELNSMIDLAGNKGVFSILAAQKTNIKHILCTDYDESAIDDLYLYLKQKNIKQISPVLLNFIYPIPQGEYYEGRLKADIAVALAVTHHLLLTQSISIDDILKKTGEFSNRYVLIEFMPLGLWDGKEAPPVPADYTTSWFKEKFQNRFTLLLEEQTEPNRIFFLGEKKQERQ